MVRKILRAVLVSALVVSGGMASAHIARAAVDGVSEANNVQDGNNSSTSSQAGTGKSGDAVGGQVTGVVSSGRTSVDAKNTSKDSDVTSGDATGSNSASSFTGQNSTEGGGTTVADITNSCQRSGGCFNVQDGNNNSSLNQTSNATTGDGVAGEVIGVVTAAGGSASVVAQNTSTDVSVETGDADSNNDASAFVGQNATDGGGATITASAADIDLSCQRSGGCDNVQDGSNRGNVRQVSNATSGDGVAGQVIGAVAGGATSIDASNTSDSVDVTTGDANSNNDAALFSGQNATDGGNATVTAGLADVTNSCQRSGGCFNVQDGSNRGTLNQNATSTTGDGVGGEVIGVVTSAGGSASVVAANKTTNSDVETGDSGASNSAAAFVGQNSTDGGDLALGADLDLVCFESGGCDNVQDGNNRLSGNQTAVAATGDGVAGQVLGVVSAGAASVDATNRTDDSSAQTGDADATNSNAAFVGQNATDGGNTSIADVTNACFDSGGCFNVQDGNNAKTFSQGASGTSGDAVAGQVSGVVTSAGGSASVVLANTSSSIDSTSGDGTFDNSDDSFTGQNATDGGAFFIGIPAVTGALG